MKWEGWRVSNIIYTDPYGNYHELPASTEENPWAFDRTFNYGPILSSIPHTSTNGNDHLEKVLHDLIELFHKYDLQEIGSQKQIGAYIEIRFEHDCIVWYKKEDSILQGPLGDMFDHSLEITPSWHILRTKMTEKQIEEYKQ